MEKRNPNNPWKWSFIAAVIGVPVLVLAFVDQLWNHDLPCPLCTLQRAAFIAAGFGLALNLIFGPRPSHYGVMILGAAATKVS